MAQTNEWIVYGKEENSKVTVINIYRHVDTGKNYFWRRFIAERIEEDIDDMKEKDAYNKGYYDAATLQKRIDELKDRTDTEPGNYILFLMNNNYHVTGIVNHLGRYYTMDEIDKLAKSGNGLKMGTGSDIYDKAFFDAYAAFLSETNMTTFYDNIENLEHLDEVIEMYNDNIVFYYRPEWMWGKA